MTFFCTTLFSQNLKEKKINYFVEEAQKEFKLTNDQAKELLEARTVMANESADILKKAKNNEITKEEQAEKQKVVNQNFKKVFEKLTGKTNKELEPFYDKMREEIQKLK